MRGNFKVGIIFVWMELFLHCLSSISLSSFEQAKRCECVSLLCSSSCREAAHLCKDRFKRSSGMESVQCGHSRHIDRIFLCVSSSKKCQKVLLDSAFAFLVNFLWCTRSLFLKCMNAFRVNRFCGWWIYEIEFIFGLLNHYKYMILGQLKCFLRRLSKRVAHW